MLNQKQLERFWKSVDKNGPNGCWIWVKGGNKSGYGQFRVGVRKYSTHRLSYALAHGNKMPELYVLHRCDNPSCVNPDHLFLGTGRDNIDDMMSKGRQTRGERNGRAKLTRDMVTQIRREYASGRYSQSQLGARYGVTQVQIGHIVRGEHWR